MVGAPYLGLDYQGLNPSGTIICNYGSCDLDVMYCRTDTFQDSPLLWLSGHDSELIGKGLRFEP